MHQFGRWLWGSVLVIAVSLTASLPAHANINFLPGNNPQPDEDNVLFNNTGSGTTVSGMTNNNTNPVEVDFSSSQVLVPTASGQADIQPFIDNSIHNITITVPNGWYEDLIVDPVVGKAAGGGATVTVVANDGTFTFPGANQSYDLGTGNNFLTIVATNNEQIISTTLTADGGFAELKQPRISGATVGPLPSVGPLSGVTPEPSTLALLATGALPLLRLRRGARKA